MTTESVSDLVPILQVAIGPVILISCAGLLLLSMTNRLGRVIDRARILAHERRGGGIGDRACIQPQIEVLIRRAGLIRCAIVLVGISVLFAALLIVALFVAALCNLKAAWLIAGLFIACMAALVGSIAAFLWDLQKGLHALKLELHDTADEAGSE